MGYFIGFYRQFPAAALWTCGQVARDEDPSFIGSPGDLSTSPQGATATSFQSYSRGKNPTEIREEPFHEVSVALDEVLNGLSTLLSSEQRVEALLYYAENDAFPEWLCALRDHGSQ